MRFYQDGNIECEVRATGLMVATPYPEGEPPPPFGTVVDTNTYAPYHQHFLIARLDLDIDGDANTVMETDSVAPPVSQDNPYGLALVTSSTPIRSEAESARDYNWSTQRGWSVVNPNKVNKYGTNVGYKLVPGACFPAMMDPTTPQYLRAPVIGHNLWVTRYSMDERWPARANPTQSTIDTGISEWIKDDARALSTPTWSSGTSSAFTTSHAWRSGRSCPSTWCRSGSSPRASSTRTPRWTRRPWNRTRTNLPHLTGGAHANCSRDGAAPAFPLRRCWHTSRYGAGRGAFTQMEQRRR